ncbi:MAG: regulatory protein RecX [Candidatus Pacebacteria bacterium]|nr:regulatory protein RecX [Candidatus Paceibacterota bacterium]
MDNKNQAIKFAIKLLSIRKRSVFEMRNRLKRKEFGNDVIDEVIKELFEYKYLNDEKFAEAYINDRINFNPRGSFLIKKELREKGVAENIVDQKIKELFPEEKEIELARKAAEKKMGTLNKDLEKNKVYQKVGAYLQAKGYTSYIIREVLSLSLQ